MKLVLLALLLFSTAASAFEKVKIDGKLFVARGFDDNDLVEIMAVGTLPNSCYRNPSFEIDAKDNKYSIQLFALYAQQPEGCREVSISYIETINFGHMYSGEYFLKLNNKNTTEEKKLVIKEASNQLVDEFLYGNVSGISESETGREIELIGANPTSCMVYHSMATEVQNSMIILRPKFKEVGFCSKKSTPFKIKYTVPKISRNPKEILIHVRVMNGRSYNYLYQNRAE